jgi:hypothetical protein
MKMNNYHHLKSYCDIGLVRSFDIVSLLKHEMLHSFYSAESDEKNGLGHFCPNSILRLGCLDT